MAAKDPTSFPVKMTKGTGKDKVVRHAHSPIAYQQLKTQGWNLIQAPKAADSAKPADPKAADSAKPADPKAADDKK